MINYFKYDLKQLWRNNGRAVILLGFLSVFTYLVWVIFSLIFTGSWQAPGAGARVAFFLIGLFILVLYNTRTYGYLTEKKAGSAWLMIPASTGEKVASMLFITIVVIPLAYIVSYLLLDSIIALLDPTAGGSLIGGIAPLISAINEELADASLNGVNINWGLMLIPLTIQLIGNSLYFLLCGICFKKWKIVGAFGILLAFSMVITPIVSGLSVHFWAPYLNSLRADADASRYLIFFNSLFNWSTLIDTIWAVVMAVAIYFRVKTLKH